MIWQGSLEQPACLWHLYYVCVSSTHGTVDTLTFFTYLDDLTG